MSQKARNYCLTIFDENELVNLQHESVKYSAYGDEICPSTGRKHYQAFVIFSTSRVFTYVKKLFPTAHIEVMRGRLMDNERYCSKEGSYHEYGDKPKSQEYCGKRGREYWEEQLQLAKKDPGLCDPQLQITHRNSLKGIYYDAQKRVKHLPLEKLDNYWFYGPSGSGKSTTARSENPDHFVKQCNKWWDNYNGESVIIIDDMNITHDHMAHYLDLWADKFPINIEIKGGSLTARPKRIIVTSRYLPCEIFKDQSQVISISRRFKIREFQYDPLLDDAAC